MAVGSNARSHDQLQSSYINYYKCVSIIKVKLTDVELQTDSVSAF